jgi:dolichol kinase
VVSASSETGSEQPFDREEVGLSLRRELTRKALHLLSTAVPVGYAVGLPRSAVVAGLAVALGAAVAVELGRVRSARTRTVFDARVGLLLRAHERRNLSGATWLTIALLVAAVCFPRDVAIAAMCAVSLGDAAAAVVGRALARARPAQRKSFSGSAACFTTSAIAAHTIAGFVWREALIVGALAAVAERPRRPLDDNLRITIAVGCGILLWRMGFS